MKLKNYPLALIGNMDETSVFFDMVLNTFLTEKGSNKCFIGTSGERVSDW